MCCEVISGSTRLNLYPSTEDILSVWKPEILKFVQIQTYSKLFKSNKNVNQCFKVDQEGGI